MDGAARNGNAPGGRVLVIGLGFLGSHVFAALRDAGYAPVALTRSPPPGDIAAGAPSTDIVIGDAANPDDLRRSLDDVCHVVFCAGGLLPARSELEPDLDAELTLTPLFSVLEALRERKGVGFTYLSSGGTVYGEPEILPTPEAHPTRPTGSYGRLRLACECEIGRHSAEHGLRARVLRCATVYGEYQQPDRGQGAVNTFLRRVEEGEPIFVYADPENGRDYIYAGDVGRVVAALLGRDDGPAVLNVGSGRCTSLDDLIALVERQVARPAHVVHHPARPFDVRRIVLDISSLRALTGFEPTDLEAGIDVTHRWLSRERMAQAQSL